MTHDNGDDDTANRTSRPVVDGVSSPEMCQEPVRHSIYSMEPFFELMDNPKEATVAGSPREPRKMKCCILLFFGY